MLRHDPAAVQEASPHAREEPAAAAAAGPPAAENGVVAVAPEGGVAPTGRARLKRKQPPPQWYWQEVEERAQGLDMEWPVRRAARRAYVTQHCRSHVEEVRAARGYEERRRLGAEAWAQASNGEKSLWLCHAKAGTLETLMHMPAGTTEAGMGVEGETVQVKPGCTELVARGFLFTWNGAWGKACPQLQELLRQGGVAPQLPRGVALKTFCETLSRSSELKSVFEGFWEFVCSVAQSIGALHVSAALEVSTRSETPGRLHFHCFLSHPTNRLCLAKHWWRFRFDNREVGHIQRCARTGRGSMVSCAEGHYYLQMRKVGSIMQRTNYVKNRDFAVSSRWPMGQWRVAKLTHEAVKLEVVESRHRVLAALAEIAGVEAAEANVRATRQEEVLSRGLALRPFKEASPQEQQWLAQYKGGVAPLLRYKVLVYDGPSRLGKSQRAEHWFGAAETLTVNCQDVSQPNLRAWLSGVSYKAILYDEGDWRLVWGNRKLMQAGPKGVLLAQSACNQHAYSVLVHGVPMMLTSNGFWRGCDDDEARDWVETNIVYIRIAEPTWQSAAKEASPQ